MIRRRGNPCPRRLGAAAMFVAAFTAAGCASGGAGPGPSGYEDELGLFAFTARVPATVSVPELRGTIEVTADTVIVLLDGADCRPFPGGVESLVHRCRGGEVTFSFPRAHPLRRPRAQVNAQIPYTRRTCEAYQDTAAGRVCVQYVDETAYRTERRTVPLSLKRVGPGGEAATPAAGDSGLR